MAVHICCGSVLLVHSYLVLSRMPFFENARSADLRNSTFNDFGCAQYNHTTNIYPTEERALEALKPAVRTGYDPRCMEGTRESVFKEVDDWLDNFGTSESVVWCHKYLDWWF